MWNIEHYEILSNTGQCESQEVEDHTIVVRYKSSEAHNALQNTLPKLTTTCTVYTKRYEWRNTPYQILATLYEPNDKRMPTTWVWSPPGQEEVRRPQASQLSPLSTSGRSLFVCWALIQCMSLHLQLLYLEHFGNSSDQGGPIFI